MFRFSTVTVSYGSRVALEVESLALEAGSLVAVMGPNGSGKTTLLRALAGLDVRVHGTLERTGRPTIGWVDQHHDHRRWLPITVDEVLRIGRFRHHRLVGRLGADDRAAIAEAAARLEVDDLGRRSFGSLSGGQQQRVLIAMAVAQQADCLLLDEPITGLDLVSQRIIVDVMESERDAGRLVVLTTHHLDEAQRCDRVLLLSGRIIADGAPHDVLVPEHLAAAFGHRLLTGADCDEPTHDHRPLLLDDHGHGHQNDPSPETSLGTATP